MAREKLARYGMGGLLGALAVLVGFSGIVRLNLLIKKLLTVNSC